MKRLLQFALLLSGLVLCVPAHAQFSLLQSATTNTGCTSSCTVNPPFSAIAAGSLVVAIIGTGSGTTPRASAGSSNAGTWTVPSGCTTNTDCHETDTSAGMVGIEYILSSTGSPTSIICTATATIGDCTVYILSFTCGPVSFDKGAVRDQTTSVANPAGVSAGTLTGTNDVIFQGATSSGNLSGCANLFSGSCTQGYYPGGNGAAVLINTASNTAGTWTSSSNGRAALFSMAIKENTGCGGAGPTQVGGFLVGP